MSIIRQGLLTAAVGYTSDIIALITFIGILAYHIVLQVRDTKLWKRIPIEIVLH